MKKLTTLLALLALSSQVFAAGKIQNEDVKSETDLTNAGSDKTHLINDAKVYVTANGINDRLDNAIVAGSIGGSGGGGNQLLSNPGFENGTAATGWTITTATGANELTTIYAGKHSEKLTYSSSTGDIAQSVTPTVNTNGINMEASCKVNTTMTTIQVCALSGGTEVQCQSAASSGSWTYVAAAFPGPANGTTVGVRVKTSSSSSGTVYVDDCYVGPSRLIGSGYMATDWVSFTQTLSSSGTAPVKGTTSIDSAYWRRVGDSMEVRWEYNQTAAGSGSNGTGTLYLPLPSGYSIDTTKVNTSGTAQSQDFGTWTQGTGPRFGSVVYGTSTAVALSVNYDFNAQALNNTLLAAANDGFGGSPTKYSVHYIVPILGWSSNQTAYRSDITPASWSGYHTQGGVTSWTTTSSTYADFTPTGTAAIVERRNRNFGTVSTAGSNLPGITFTPPRSGRYWICAYPKAYEGGGVDGALALTDGTTIITEASVDTGSRTVVPVCGIYDAASSTSTTIKIQGKIAAGGTLHMDQTTGSSVSSIEWTVTELDSPMPAPYLTGSVTSTSSGAEHIERAKIADNGTTCSITSQSGSWISSVTRVGIGECQINFTAGEFSSAPSCFFGPEGANSVGVGATYGLNAVATTSGITPQVIYSGANSDQPFNIMCMGPR